MSVAGALLVVGPALGRGQDEGLVLDGTGPQQHLPVVLAGFPGKRAGHYQEARTALHQRAVELRKADVVADRESNAAEGRLGHDYVSAWSHRGGFGESVATGAAQIDVEQMDLPVHRSEPAVGCHHDTGVVHPGVAFDRLRKGAAHQPDAVLTGPLAQEAHDLAAEGLGAGNGQSLAAQVGEVLGQRHQLRTLLGGRSHQLGGARKVARHPVGGRHLHEAYPHLRLRPQAHSAARLLWALALRRGIGPD